MNAHRLILTGILTVCLSWLSLVAGAEQAPRPQQAPAEVVDSVSFGAAPRQAPMEVDDTRPAPPAKKALPAIKGHRDKSGIEWMSVPSIDHPVFVKELTFYAHRPIYQMGSDLIGDGRHNISCASEVDEPHGNPNGEWPWKVTGGTHRCSSSSLAIRKFHHIPGKIEWWKTFLPSQREVTHSSTGKRIKLLQDFYHHGIQWEFPAGTTFSEVLYLPDSVGRQWPFEVRLRTKDSAGKWQPNVFRPITSREEYDEVLRGESSAYYLPVVDVRTLTRPHDGVPDFVMRELWSGKKRRAPEPQFEVKLTAAMDVLPAIPEATVQQLLSRPFQSVRGKSWIAKEGIEGYAPTTEADFHIIPRHYDGGHIEISQKSCMQCHQDTLRYAWDMDFARSWYGHVRGSDGILSFHIFDESIIGDHTAPGPWRNHLAPTKMNSNLPLRYVAGRGQKTAIVGE